MSHSRRVFIDFPEFSSPAYGTAAPLSRSDSHHFLSVLRLEAGDEVTAVDRKSGKEYSAIISSIDDNQAVLRILAERAVTKERSRVGTLIFGLAKGKKCDLVCEKACELGVGNIILWQSDRSIVRIDSERDRERKLDRWQRVTETAAKQSGNDSIPKIHLALDLKELFHILDPLTAAHDRRFICSLSPEARLPSMIDDVPNSVHLAVGPEGDFTPEEEAALREHGFAPLSLGPLVLRCETAAIVAISMVHGAWGFRPRTEH